MVAPSYGGLKLWWAVTQLCLVVQVWRCLMSDSESLQIKKYDKTIVDTNIVNILIFYIITDVPP